MHRDRRLERLDTLIEDDYSKSVVLGADYALADKDNPLRATSLASAMRLLVEHSLRTLAPDEKVMNCSWFKPMKDDGKPTRAQRAFYAIYGGLSDQVVKENLSCDLDAMKKKLIAAVDDMSKTIHAPNETIISDQSEQDRFADLVISAVSDFFSTIKRFRTDIAERLAAQISETTAYSMVTETLGAVDILATHHSVDEVYIDRVFATSITDNEIIYRASGTVFVTLQWGSNSDLRNDIGAEISNSFPFYCDYKAPIDNPFELEEGDPSEMEGAAYPFVDTSSWYH